MVTLGSLSKAIVFQSVPDQCSCHVGVVVFEEVALAMCSAASLGLVVDVGEWLADRCTA